MSSEAQDNFLSGLKPTCLSLSWRVALWRRADCHMHQTRTGAFCLRSCEFSPPLCATEPQNGCEEQRRTPPNSTPGERELHGAATNVGIQYAAIAAIMFVPSILRPEGATSGSTTSIVRVKSPVVAAPYVVASTGVCPCLQFDSHSRVEVASIAINVVVLGFHIAVSAHRRPAGTGMGHLPMSGLSALPRAHQA